jgi:hypothetical protein
VSTTTTYYMTFRGYCTHCGNPAGEGIHQNDSCNMEGAEVRLRLLGIAFEEWLKVERADRVIKAARSYLEWADAETKKELQAAIRWFEKGTDAVEVEHEDHVLPVG